MAFCRVTAEQTGSTKVRSFSSCPTSVDVDYWCDLLGRGDAISKVPQSPFSMDLIRAKNIQQGHSKPGLNTLKSFEIHAALTLLESEKHGWSDFQALGERTIRLFSPRRTQVGGYFLLVSLRHA